MDTKLTISSEILLPGSRRVLDMTGRCAFALCSDGDFDIKIMNVAYRVRKNDIFTCMPFVAVEVTEVREPSRIIFGGIRLEDVMSVINRTVNTDNILAIQQTPLVHINDEEFQYINSSITAYLKEIADSERASANVTCRDINQEIIDSHSRLIVAQIMKIYFYNLPMEASGHTHRDILFQKFMLDLYANFRERRDVRFYAQRSGMSLKYFSTVVRQLSGRTPSEWIETYVVGEAKTLLNVHTRNIKEIASTLRFPDAPTFTKYFRRVTGLTPTTYRQSIAK